VFLISIFLFQSPEQWYETGVRLAAAGQTGEAIQAYRKAVSADSRHADAWNNLGDLLRRTGDRAGALDAVNRALAANPDHPKANLNAALVRIELKRFRDALPLIERARKGLGDQPVFDYLFARTHLELNDYESAESYLNRFRQSASSSATATIELATLLLDQKQYARAAEMLLAVPPEKRNDEIVLQLGQTWYALDQMEKARDAFVDFIRRAPSDFRGHLWTAYADRGLGDPESAYQELQQALMLNPQSSEALVAQATLELERNRPAESIALCDRALKLNAEDTAALLARGLALLRSDNPTDAAATLAKIPRSAVEYSRALYLLARAYRQSRQIERADATLREFRALEAASEQSTTPARKKPR